jgi:hypothetical protein
VSRIKDPKDGQDDWESPNDESPRSEPVDPFSIAQMASDEVAAIVDNSPLSIGAEPVGTMTEERH